MAKKSMVVKNQRPAKFSTQAYTRCERCGRPQFTANLNFAVSVFANWLTKVNCQALKKLHGNLLIIV